MDKIRNVKSLLGHTSNIWIVIITNDDRFALSGGADVILYIHNLKNYKLIRKIYDH